MLRPRLFWTLMSVQSTLHLHIIFGIHNTWQRNFCFLQENALDISKQHGQYDIKPQVYEKAEIKEEDIEMFDPYEQAKSL